MVAFHTSMLRVYLELKLKIQQKYIYCTLDTELSIVFLK